MSTSPSSNPIRFGDFEVDPRAGELRKRGLLIKLQEQPFQLLLLLLARPGEVVTREEARNALWKDDTFVDFDHGLGAALNRLRAALGDSASHPRLIETLPRHGYRFIAAVERDSPDADDVALKTPEPESATPFRRRRSAFLILSAVAAVIAVGLLIRGNAPIRRPPTGRVMLAVLPLDNMSNDADQEYFCDGLTEELISYLGRAHPERLGVIARTSSMQYKGTRKNVSQIANELKVDYVLEGSVRREGQRVRVTVQLINAEDQTHVWAQSYDRPLAGILALQDGVSQQITNALWAELLPETARTSKSTYFSNAEAYESYLKGRYFLSRRGADGYRSGIDHFQKAVAIDPSFAAGYAGLADAYMLLGTSFDLLPPREALEKARVFAEKALELDPTLAEAHATLGVVQRAHHWDWPAEEESLRRAIRLNPSYATAHHWLGSHFAKLGRFAEGLAEMDRALKLDPLSLIINTERGLALYFARRYDEAETQLAEALTLDEDFAPAHAVLALVYLQTQMHERALDAAETVRELEKDSSTGLVLAGLAHAGAGRSTEARAILEELERLAGRQYVSAVHLATLSAYLDQREDAFRWMEKAFDERATDLRFLKVDPLFDPMRSHPRFPELLRRMNFPE